MKFRACKVRINDPDTGKDELEVLLTNLNRQEFPLPRMKKLYHLRWGIESSFRKLKYDLSCIQFHSKQDNFIEMEIYAHMIMFNTVRPGRKDKRYIKVKAPVCFLYCVA